MFPERELDVKSLKGLVFYIFRADLRMIRPGLMSMVKLIICARKACGKILDLTGNLAVRRHSHCTSVSNWGLSLLCFRALQETSSLIKQLRFSATSFSSSYCNKGHNLYHAHRLQKTLGRVANVKYRPPNFKQLTPCARRASWCLNNRTLKLHPEAYIPSELHQNWFTWLRG